MIAIDTSALVAILLDEPEKPHFTRKIVDAAERVLSAASYAELGIVLSRRLRVPAQPLLTKCLAALDIRLVATDAAQAGIAVEAYAKYGKGFHPAALNFGDCFAYALAVSVNAPLLFKGADFQLTDVMIA